MNILTIIHCVLLALNFLIFFMVWLQLRGNSKQGEKLKANTEQWKQDNQEWKKEVRGKLDTLINQSITKS